MDEVALFNAIEVVWWLIVAVLVGVESQRSRRPRGLAVCLCAALIVFAISDVIEFRTGAWWRPWWLAVLKITCGTVLGLLALRLFRGTKHRRRD